MIVLADTLNRNRRDGTIDLLRMGGILLMVMGHVTFGSFFNKWIHGFHMPLWFIISGYFMTLEKVSERKISDYIKSKINNILVPYFLFGGGMKSYVV